MPGKPLFYKISIAVVIVLGLALVFYTNYRAATLSITHDEGVIYKLISSHSRWDILNYVIPQDHMINTLLIKISCQQFQDSEYVVRLPNLLGHLAYVIFSILLLIKMKNPWIILPGFILLNFNPYLLDFFSIARGYGLSVSFMMVSFYFAYSFIQSRKKTPLIFCFLFATLSVLTVYTLLNYLVALCALVGLMMMIWLAEGRFRLTKKVLITYGWYALIIIVSFAWLYFRLREPLQRVQSENFIYGENQTNFLKGTLRPIAFRTIYNFNSGALVTLISSGVIFFWGLSILAMTIMMTMRNFSFTSRLVFSSVIILAVIASSVIIQNEWLGIRYISNRTATFIATLMVLPLIGLTDEMTRTKIFKIPGLLIICFVAGFFLVNTGRHANFKWYLEWKFDSTTREMMHDLCEDVGPDPGKTVKMGICWLEEPSINFYKKTWNLDWLQSVDRNGYVGDFDYFYVVDADSVLSKDIFKDKIKIKSYKDSGMILLKKAPLNEENSQ
jgi:hypothetical protein